ncbi:hypothetical protein ACTXGQ_00140 [Marinobacter sp. 1Y8]
MPDNNDAGAPKLPSMLLWRARTTNENREHFRGIGVPPALRVFA